MDLGEILSWIGQSAVNGAATGLAALLVMRVHLSYHRRDIDRAHKRLDDHDQWIRAHIERRQAERRAET